MIGTVYKCFVCLLSVQIYAIFDAATFWSRPTGEEGKTKIFHYNIKKKKKRKICGMRTRFTNVLRVFVLVTYKEPLRNVQYTEYYIHLEFI